MSANLPDYMNTARGTGRSPSLWHDCPLDLINSDNNFGYTMKDDFQKYSSTASGTLNASGLPTFEGACTITGTSIQGGEVALLCSASNEEGALEMGGGVSAPFMISDTTATAKKLWFETRIKKSLITDKDNVFVGLAAPGSGIADFIADDGDDFADVAVMGFVQWEADGDSWDFVYQANGQAFSTLISGVKVPVADTYANLGFKYDPTAEDAKKITIYVDNVEQSTYVTATQIAAAIFPDAEALTPLVAVKSSDAADKTVTMAWYQCTQLY